MEDRLWAEAATTLMYAKNLLQEIGLHEKCPSQLFTRRAKPPCLIFCLDRRWSFGNLERNVRNLTLQAGGVDTLGQQYADCTHRTRGTSNLMLSKRWRGHRVASETLRCLRPVVVIFGWGGGAGFGAGGDWDLCGFIIRHGRWRRGVNAGDA